MLMECEEAVEFIVKTGWMCGLGKQNQFRFQDEGTVAAVWDVSE